MKWFFKTYTYWLDLASEIRIWWIFRSASKESTDRLNEENLRVDWLGRIYGVINMPEEVVGAAPQVQQAYVLQQINKWGPVTTEIGLSDVIYPEIERISGTSAYLVVMWPQYEALDIWSILGNIVKTTAVTFGLFLLARLVWVNSAGLINYAKELLQLAQ